MTSTIQIRTDQKIKKKAQEIFQQLGLDMSSAIQVFLRQVVLRKGIPFTLVTENGLTIDQEMEILQAEKDADAGMNITRKMTPSEALVYLDNVK